MVNFGFYCPHCEHTENGKEADCFKWSKENDPRAQAPLCPECRRRGEFFDYREGAREPWESKVIWLTNERP